MISLHLTVNNIKIHCCYVTSLGGHNFDKKNRNLMQEILRSKLNFSIYTVTIIFKILFFRVKEQTASQMPYPHYIMLFYRKVRKIHAFFRFYRLDFIKENCHNRQFLVSEWFASDNEFSFAFLQHVTGSRQWSYDDRSRWLKAADISGRYEDISHTSWGSSSQAVDSASRCYWACNITMTLMPSTVTPHHQPPIS